jgi:hypothetical protein
MSEESELDRNVIGVSPYLIQRWIASSIVVGRLQLTWGQRKESIVEPYIHDPIYRYQRNIDCLYSKDLLSRKTMQSRYLWNWISK